MARALPAPPFPLAAALVAAALAGCRSGAPSVGELERAIQAAEEQRAKTSGALEPGVAVLRPAAYRGPGVVGGDSGPAPYVRPLWHGFRTQPAFELVEALDQHYRAPASAGFDASLDLVAERLVAAGFDGADERFELRWLASEEPEVGWHARSARVVLHAAGEEPLTLHAFDDPARAERVLLPIHAPAAHVRGAIALSLDELDEGAVLVTNAPLRQVLRRAEAQGAAAVLSASLGDYNEDPTGGERHLDAIAYGTVPEGTALPVAHVSPRSYEALAAAAADGEVELAADVELVAAPLRTLVALVHGRGERAREAVVVAAHIDEPGAGDNASGVATLVEGATALVEAIGAGRIAPPERTLVLLFGEEFTQSEAFLDEGGFRVVAGLSADMTGQSFDRTGAIALLERGPDPGAHVALPPDEHSSWGQSRVEEGMEVPNGLAVIARCAMVDVARLEEQGSGRPWPAADHPWEGGSDHDVFLRAGIPAVLFWHFTDFTYHTSLDRPAMVDPDEMRRTGAAVLATALAVASARPADLSRYVDSLRLELDVRLAAATTAADPALVAAWRQWGTGARSWLRKLCLDLDTDEAAELMETALPDAAD